MPRGIGYKATKKVKKKAKGKRLNKRGFGLGR